MEDNRDDAVREDIDTENITEEGGEKEYVERKRWLFFGLPFTFTKYTINEKVITIDSGLLNTTENDCYLYKIQDVELKTSGAHFRIGHGGLLYGRQHASAALFGAYKKRQRNQKLYSSHLRGGEEKEAHVKHVEY